MFMLRFTQNALDDLAFMKRAEQAYILNEVRTQLSQEPLVVTRNRKPLRQNELARWELRVGAYRVFYDVEGDFVKVKAVGRKEHDKLLIRGKEYEI